MSAKNTSPCTIITGQTASGKSGLALEMAKKTQGIIINFDARHVYRELSITTGKDLPKDVRFVTVERKSKRVLGYWDVGGVQLWGFDAVSPNSPFSSSNFCMLVDTLLQKYIPANTHIVFVGGTYFYIKHLLYGFETEGIGPDWQLRAKLEVLDVGRLQKKLEKLSPQKIENMNTSDRNNPRRLIRAIEIAMSLERTTRTMGQKTRAFKHQTPNTKFHIQDFIGLRFACKETLMETIGNRVEERVKKGAIEEVRKLLVKGYTESDPGMKTIGVPQLVDYIKGKRSKEEAIAEWKTREVQYAKRQLTFMKTNEKITWSTV